MAGRLRKQFDALHKLSWAVHEAAEQLVEAAPSGVFSDENFLKREFDELMDEKTRLWHEALEGIATCDDALCRLHDMLSERIGKLPTFRPPQMVEASAEPPAELAVSPPRDSGTAIPDTSAGS